MFSISDQEIDEQEKHLALAEAAESLMFLLQGPSIFSENKKSIHNVTECLRLQAQTPGFLGQIQPFTLTH
jgi:hypothetical protein